MHGNLYGGEYGTFNSHSISGVVWQISSLIWAFLEYNPLIKQIVELRGLYVVSGRVRAIDRARQRYAERVG